MLTKDLLIEEFPWKGFDDKVNWTNIVNKLNEGPYYPPLPHIFNAFQDIKPDDVKIVLLGQDPYVNEGEAHGFSFSTLKEIIPPSLKNIFKELYRSYNKKEEKVSGDLRGWKSDGVLMLNSILTVSPKEPLSHKDIGWEQLTNNILQKLSNNGVIILAFGSYAREICNKIKNATFIETGHPSPRNTFNPFVGSDVFVKANQMLLSKSIRPIRWIEKLKRIH